MITSLTTPEPEVKPQVVELKSEPRDAEQFNELSNAQQRLFLSQFLKPIYKPFTAVVILPHFSIVATYEILFGTKMHLLHAKTMSFEAAISKLKVTSGQKQLWSYLTDKKTKNDEL